MEIEDILAELQQKDRKKRFSELDAQQLLELGANNPCHLATQLLLIEYAQGFWLFFPEKWTVYYQAVINRGNECWTPDELAEVYILGNLLYYYDQDDKASCNAAKKAFELAPYHPAAIMV